MYFRRLVSVLLCFIVLASFSGQVSATSNNRIGLFHHGRISPVMIYIVSL